LHLSDMILIEIHLIIIIIAPYLSTHTRQYEHLSYGASLRAAASTEALKLDPWDHTKLPAAQSFISAKAESHVVIIYISDLQQQSLNVY